MLPVIPTPAAGGQVPSARDIPSMNGGAMLSASPSAADRFTESYIKTMLGSPW